MATAQQIEGFLARQKERRQLTTGNKTACPEIVWVATEEEAAAWVPTPGKIAIAEAFREFEEFPGRFLDAPGGRGSGKTKSFARLLARRMIWKGKRLLCCREVMDSIEESSKAEIVEAINALGGAADCVIQDKRIFTASGGYCTFIGLSNTKEKVRGFANFDICWVEEAATVTKASWDRLIPTIRKTGSQVWISWNPNKITDETWQRFVAKDIYPAEVDGKPYHLRRVLNFDINPWFHLTELAVQERLDRDADEDHHGHIWLGKPVGVSADAIIKPKWLEACLDFHTLLMDDRNDYDDDSHLVGGFDTGATSTGDASSLALQQNNVLCYLTEFFDPDPVAAAVRVWTTGDELGVSEVRYDVIGVGHGTRGKVRELNEQAEARGVSGVSFLPFDASGNVVSPNAFVTDKRRNKDHFLNIKAQSWFSLAARAQNVYLFRLYYKEHEGSHIEKVRAAEAKLGAERMANMISIDTWRIDPKLLERLKGELCTVTWLRSEGKLQVETKKQLAARGVPSTNMADAVVMAYAPMRRGVYAVEQ